jgi:hypothetical protein
VIGLRYLPAAILILATTFPAVASQREYTLGAGLNLVGGGDTNPGFGVSGGKFRPFYGAYPSTTLTSTGARSAFELSYAFGFDRTETEEGLNALSHSAGFGLTREMGSRWTLSISDRFYQSTDTRTFNAFLGVAVGPEGLVFIFDPVTTNTTTRTNSASLGLDYAMSPRSALAFTLGHSLRRYGDGSLFSESLSDQQTGSAGVTYRRELNPRSTVSIGYDSRYAEYREFENTLTQNARLGFTHELSPELILVLGGGPTYVSGQNAIGQYVGYNASASLRKQLQAEASLAIYFRAQSGSSSGLGSVSDTRSAGVSVDHSARRLTVFLDLSVFDARGRLDNENRHRGISGAATLGYPLGEVFSLEGGVRYQRYTETSDFGFTQERAFLSLRYDDPDLWRFLR